MHIQLEFEFYMHRPPEQLVVYIDSFDDIYVPIVDDIRVVVSRISAGTFLN